MATPRCFHYASGSWQWFELCWRQSDFTSLPSRLRAFLDTPWTIMTFPLRKSVSGRRMSLHRCIFTLFNSFVWVKRLLLIKLSKLIGDLGRLGSCPRSWKVAHPSLLHDRDWPFGHISCNYLARFCLMMASFPVSFSFYPGFLMFYKIMKRRCSPDVQ